MKTNFIKIVAALVISLLMLLAGCDYKGPEAIWNPEADLGAIPEITEVDPAGEAGVGVGKIHIKGNNLGSEARTSVYFDGELATINSFTPSEIVVYRPKTTGDAVTIKVLVDGAYVVANHLNYKIPVVYDRYGNFVQKGVVTELAMDAAGNMYALVVKNIYKVTPDGINFPIGKQTFRGKTSDFRMGSDGYLYVKKLKDERIYRIDTNLEDPEQVAEEWQSLAVKASFIDIDENGNIFGAGEKTGMSVLKDNVTGVVGDYEDVNVTGIRVYSGSVYASDDSGVLWKSAILDAQGSLGAKEKVFDWADAGYEEGIEMLSFDIAGDGTIVFGSNHSDPMLMLHPDGSLEPLYASIMGGEVDEILWGNGENIYVNRTDDKEFADVYVVKAGQAGAPYFGRTL